MYLSPFFSIYASPKTETHQGKTKKNSKKMKYVAVKAFKSVILQACVSERWLHLFPGRNSSVSVAWCVSLQPIWYQGQGLLMDGRLVSPAWTSRGDTEQTEDSAEGHFWWMVIILVSLLSLCLSARLPSFSQQALLLWPSHCSSRRKQN